MNIYYQLHPNGQPGDLGAAAVRAVVEVDRRGNAHAPEGPAAWEMELGQDFATATLVQVCAYSMWSCFIV